MFNLFLEETRRTWIQTKRYPLELIIGMLMMGATFYALILGAQYLSGPAVQFGARLDGVILGYGLWMLVLMAMNGIALVLQEEARTGTLEQIYMSVRGPVQVLLQRSLAGLALNLAISVGMLLLMLVVTGRSLTYRVEVLLPLASVLLGAHGLGLLLGGLALVFKRVQGALRLFQIGLLGLVMVPVETWTGAGRIGGLLIPIAPAAGQMRALMTLDQPFVWREFGFGLANGLAYFLAGVLLFGIADRIARDRGMLGQY